MSDFDLRIIRYDVGGVRRGIVPALSFDMTVPYGDLSTVSVKVSGPVYGAWPVYAEIAVEIWDGAAWIEPEDARFIITKGALDEVSASGIYTLTGVNMVLWFLNKAVLARGPLEQLNGDGKRVFAGVWAGTIMKTMIDEAKGRSFNGVSWAPWLSYDFSAGADSAGQPWSAAVQVSLAYDPGLTALTALSNLLEQNLVEMHTQGRTLRLFNPDTGAKTGVRIGPGFTTVPVSYDLDDLTTNLSVDAEDDLWVDVVSPYASNALGRLEGHIRQGGVSDAGTARVLARAELYKGSQARQQVTATAYSTTMARFPFKDFRLGDWVSMLRKEGAAEVRVHELVLSRDQNGKVKVSIVLNDRFVDILARMARRTKGITGGAIIGGNGNGAPSTEDRRRPLAPTGLVWETSVFTNDHNLTAAQIAIGYVPVTKGEDNVAIDVAAHILEGRRDLVGQRWQTLGDVDGDTNVITYAPLPIGETWRFRVFARSRNGIVSTRSAEVIVKLAVDTEPPQKPSAPTLTSRLGVLSVTWDGLDYVGGSQPPDFERADVWMQTANGPEVVGSIRLSGGEGTVHVTGLPYNTPYVFWLTAFDRSGNESPKSAEAAGQTTPLVDTDLIGAVIGETNIKIGAVRSQAIADGAVLSAALANLAVSEGKLAANAVTTAKIADEAIKAGKLAAGAVDRTKLAAAVVAELDGLDTKLSGNSAAVIKAQQDADAAKLAATGAQSTADGKGRVFFQDDAPTGADRDAKNLWVDTTAGKNTPKRWNGSTWVAVSDIIATEAASLAAEAKGVASGAQTTADGKNAVMYAASAPAGTTWKVGDTWFDTANGNRPNRWGGTGTGWVPLALGADAIAANAITVAKIADGAISAGKLAAQAVDATKLSSSVNASISKALADAEAAGTTAAGAQASADSKTTNIYAATKPSTTGRKVGDTWFDTANGNRPSRFSGTDWVLVTYGAGAIADGAIAAVKLADGAVDTTKLANAVNTAITKAQNDATAAAGAAQTAQQSADGKSAVVYAASAPAGTWKDGDTWFDTANGNRPNRRSGNSWVAVTYGADALAANAVTLAKIADGAISTIKLANNAVDASKLSSAVNTAISNAQSSADTAQASADGKTTNLYAATAPSATGRKVGDTWFDTANDNRISRWSGTQWVLAALGEGAIANAAITNAKIADATIQAAKIGSVDAGTITVGTLAAGRIGARTITVDKLMVGSNANRVPDPDFADDTENARRANTRTTYVADSERPGAFVARTVGLADWYAVSISIGASLIKVEAGEKLVVGYEALWIGTSNGTTSPESMSRIRMRWYAADRSALSYSDFGSFLPAGGWAPISQSMTVPDGVAFAGLEILVRNQAYPSGVQIRRPWLNGQLSATFIENGAITTAKVAAGAITADTIAVNAITAQKIATNAVTADAIAANAVTADQIAANAIISSKIAANAIVAGKIAADAITAREIQAGTITATNGIIASLDAAKITVGILSADRIAASSITVSKLAVADLTNIIDDPEFRAMGEGWVAVTGSTSRWVPSDHATEGRIITVTANSSGTRLRNTRLPVVAGDAFTLRFRALSATSQARVQVRLRDRANGIVDTILLRQFTSTSDAFVDHELPFVIPSTAGIAIAEVEFEMTNAAGAGTVLSIARPSLLRRANASLIVDGSIGANAIAANAITAGKIAAGAVVAASIDAEAVTAAKLAANAVTADKIAANAITAGKIAANAITAREIQAGTITATNGIIASLDAAVITTGYLAAGRLAANSVSSREILIGDFTNSASGSDFEDDAEIPWNFAAGQAFATTSAQAHSGTRSLKMPIPVGISTAQASLATPLDVNEGDVISFELWAYRDAAFNGGGNTKLTIRSSGAQVAAIQITPTSTPNQWLRLATTYTVPAGVTTLTVGLWSDYSAGNLFVDDIVIRRMTTGKLIVDGTIEAVNMAANSIIAGKIAANAISAREIIAGSITATEIKAGTITAAEIATGAITSTKIAADAVTATQIAAGSITATNGIIASLDAAKITVGILSADRIAAGAIVASKLATDSVTTAKIAAGAVTADAIDAGAITAAKIATGAITAAKVQAGAITADALATNSVTTAKINAGAVTATEIATGAITAAKVAANAITAVAIMANTITANEIKAGTITAAELAADSVTATQIKAGAVTAGAIAAGTITATSAIVASLDASKLTAGFVAADRILANSISVSKLAISDMTNYVDDAALADVGWTRTGGSTITFVDTTGLPGRTIRFSGLASGGSAGRLLNGNRFPVLPGQKFWISGRARNDLSQPLYQRMFFYDTAGALLTAVGQTHPTTSGTTWITREVVVTVPANAVSAQLGFDIPSGAAGTTTYAWIGAIQVRRQSGGELIVDGSIGTDALAANAITAAKISALAIESGHIKSNAITADHLNVGSVEAIAIKANAVTTDKLAADAITAKHTITGALIRTSTSGARTEMNGSGIRVLNGQNVDLVRIGYGIPTGMEVRNPYTSEMRALPEQLFMTRSDFEYLGLGTTKQITLNNSTPRVTICEVTDFYALSSVAIANINLIYQGANWRMMLEWKWNNVESYTTTNSVTKIIPISQGALSYSDYFQALYGIQLPMGPMYQGERYSIRLSAVRADGITGEIFVNWNMRSLSVSPLY